MRKSCKDYEWMEEESVKRWFTGLSERTKKNYREEFGRWLNFIGLTPNQQITKRMQDLTSQNLIQRTFFETKFREYKEFLEQNTELSCPSIITQIKTVASFFSRNSLPLALKRGDWQCNKEQTVIKRKFTPTNQDIKLMYQHGSLRDRALLLALYHSGFSEVDVSQLRIEDIKNLYELPQSEHYFIEKPREKSGQIQATCISYECLHDIRALLAENNNPTEGYIFVSMTKDKGSQIETRRINEAMKTLAIKTFGKEKGKQFKTKSLRSAYNSALLRAKIQPQELKDVMMGHKRLGARGHYSYDETTIKEAYKSAFDHLTINGIQTKEDLAELRNSFKSMQVQLAETITELKDRNNKLEEKLISLGVDISDIKKTIPQIQRDIRDQSLDILQIQDKVKIKPKPIKDYT